MTTGTPVVVIRGGQAGLTAGYHLLRLGPDFVVGRLGDVAVVVVNLTYRPAACSPPRSSDGP
ncbi:hypothetical protein AQJ46_38255 [Streptomyces canus]|uniref:Uncharacterized protein n=1 Tax=Streptomyces canus TaxID=58343 RepID=A0A101RRK1_9ACTN|nr:MULTISPECIES: hypothetical protein [Streptomyces]KUN60442.1 hypothetical protein AQJ46_38255 [Streptomyces canus]MDI5907961.1 hypothetical protein [Streptomyces sp. 12257]